MSCQSDDLKPNVDPTAAIETLNEFALVNQIYQDVGNNSGDAVLSSETSATGKSSITKTDGPIITIEPLDFTTFPKTITIDYQSGVLGQDGVTRKGVVTVVSTNWYGNKDSEHTTTFNNYYHNDYKVEGTHYVKNLGTNQDNNLKFGVTVGNGKITTKTGGTISYTENSTRTWVAGSSTPLNIWDDEYLLDGTQSGISSKSIEYTLTVEEPLHFVLLPRNIKSGILNVDIGLLKDIKLNYTNSTITILGVTYPLINN
tara:strand:- start:2848 stop:3618 length:771 start_codon:yes stop_codon:yes gene_type:complete